MGNPSHSTVAAAELGVASADPAAGEEDENHGEHRGGGADVRQHGGGAHPGHGGEQRKAADKDERDAVGDRYRE